MEKIIDRRKFLKIAGEAVLGAGLGAAGLRCLSSLQRLSPLYPNPDITPTPTPPEPPLTPTLAPMTPTATPTSTPTAEQTPPVAPLLDPQEEARALRREHISSRGLQSKEDLPKEPKYDHTNQVVTGVASYYSKAGCLGCSPDQRMANGKIFDENALTIACMRFPLGSIVEIINLTNGISVIAEVTDQGGFEAWGRVADLSLGTKKALKGQDLTRIKITLLRPKA